MNLLRLWGSSDSGKSTLLNIIRMLDEQDKGTDDLDGFRIEHLNEPKAANYRNQFLGFIFQSYNLINLSSYTFNLCLICD